MDPTAKSSAATARRNSTTKVEQLRRVVDDVRLLATALDVEVPDWLESLEARVQPAGAPEGHSVTAAEPAKVISDGGTSAGTAAADVPLSSSAGATTEETGGGTPQSGPSAEVIDSSTRAEPVAATEPTVEAGADVVRGWLEKGVRYQGKRDFRRAMACFEQAIRRAPQSAAALLHRGDCWRRMSRPERAIPDFNAALAIDPQYVPAYLARGNALMSQNRHDEAIEDYTAAIALRPDAAGAYLQRAVAHARKQDNARVLHDADAALRLNPRLALAYLLRGVAYSNRKSHDRAIADLNRVLQLEPGNALAHHERGRALARKGNYPQAMVSYSKALALSPTMHLARFNRALAHRLHGSYDLAISEFTTFLFHKPRVAEAYYQRGLAKRALGNAVGAMDDFNQTLALKPTHADAAAARLETQQELFERGQAAATSTPVAEPSPVSVPMPNASARARRGAPARRPTRVAKEPRVPGRQARLLATVASIAAVLLAALSVAASLTQGSAPAFRPPPTVPVEGTVLVRGQPVEGVHVMLHPQFDIGTIQFRPSGRTDAQGRFVLSTGGPNDGAPEGVYIVTFTKPANDDCEAVDMWKGRHSEPARSRWRVTVHADSRLETLQID